jgi:hypothetical protein
MTHRNIVAVVLLGGALLTPGTTSSEPVAVRHPEGLVHGFLALRSPEGTTLAAGDLIQVNLGTPLMLPIVLLRGRYHRGADGPVENSHGHKRALLRHRDQTRAVLQPSQ